MNNVQGTLLFLGLIVVVALCLRPPYQWEHTTYLIGRGNIPHKISSQTANIGHCWIWAPPIGWEEDWDGDERKSHIAVIDRPRLGIYVGVVALVSLFGAFLVFNDRLASKKLQSPQSGRP